MPDTQPNPFYGSSPLGDALKNLGKVIMTGPTDAERIIQAEQALKLQQARGGTDSLASVFRQYGTPGFNPNEAIASSFKAGVDPARVASGTQFLASNKFGAGSQQATDAAYGHTGNYGNTGAGFREDQGRKWAEFSTTDARHKDEFNRTDARHTREFNDKPYTVGSPTGPIVATQSTAVGQPAVEALDKVKGDAARRLINQPGGIDAASQTMQHFVGAESKPQIGHNYVKDGVVYQTLDSKTDLRTGNPLPLGGYTASPQGDITGLNIRPSVQGKLQEQDIALQKLQGLTGYARTLISPQNVGIPGLIKGYAQNSAEAAGNIAKGLGYNGVSEAIQSMRERAVAGGVKPETLAGLFTFDPKLPKIETAYHMLTLSAAEALAGGMGHASDRDVRIVSHMLGSPEALFASPNSLNAKLDAVNELIALQRSNNQQNLRPGGAAPVAPPVTQAPPGGSVAPPPSAPPGAPPQEEQWQRGPDGRLIRVQ